MHGHIAICESQSRVSATPRAASHWTAGSYNREFTSLPLHISVDARFFCTQPPFFKHVFMFSINQESRIGMHPRISVVDFCAFLCFKFTSSSEFATLTVHFFLVTSRELLRACGHADDIWSSMDGSCQQSTNLTSLSLAERMTRQSYTHQLVIVASVAVLDPTSSQLCFAVDNATACGLGLDARVHVMLVLAFPLSRWKCRAPCCANIMQLSF